MKAKSSLVIAAGIVVLNNLIGHFYGPYGMQLTPAVIVAITVLIAYFSVNLKPYLKSILIVGFIGLNDIGIKLYSEGSHDKEGLGWVLLYLLIGALPAYGLLIGAIVKEKNESIVSKMIAIVIFPILLLLHLYVFQELGLGRYYSYD